MYMNVMFWAFCAFCLYQAYVGIDTGVVLGFGGRGTGISVNVVYDEHPIGYFLYLSFYLAISFGAFLVFLRWIRGGK